MELNELQILVGDSSSRGHGRTIAGAGVGRGAGEVCTSAAAGRQNGVGCAESEQKELKKL